VNLRWSVVAPLLPGEIISSWLVRAALMQGCDPMTLTLAAWPKWRLWTQDADRFFDEARLDSICALSGLGKAPLKSATLFPIANEIYGQAPPEKAAWTWFVAPGARNTKRHTGIQYCPTCMKSDSVPYFRRRWRFAWHTGCEVHGHALLDRCHACNAPVEYHRLRAEDNLITVCATCKSDLRAASVHRSQPDAQRFQLLADDILRSGIGTFQEDAIVTAQWFELANYFVSLIRSAQRGENNPLNEFLRLVGVQLPETMPRHPGHRLEILSVNDREKLLAALFPLMSTSKLQFDEALKKASITQQCLASHRPATPSWIRITAASLPSDLRRKATRSVRELDGPRPRHQVKRMMARLQRKFEMAQR